MSENRSIKVILFSDVVDSSGLMFSDEKSTIVLIERDLESFDSGVKCCGGALIKTTGDGILATFPTTSQALEFIQQFLVNRNQHTGQNLERRFGLHIGEIYHKNDDIIGQGVHLAARLQTISPVNGVAFTQGTHANIDPRFRTLAVPLGSIRLKGLPEELDCYAIHETAFLGSDIKLSAVAETTLPSSGADDRSVSVDTEVISRFISEQRELILTQSSKAAAALSDYVQDRNHLLIGARDILNRPEWGKIVGTTTQTSAELNLHRSRLASWISSSFSTKTADPWVEAIAGPSAATINTKESDPESIKNDYTNESKIPALIIAGISGIALLMITAVMLYNRIGSTTAALPGGNGVNNGASRQINIDAPNSQGNQGEMTIRPPQLPVIVSEAISENVGLQQDQGFTENISQVDKPAPKPNNEIDDAGWKRIQIALEDGVISTTDLTLTDAIGALDHWIQSFTERGNSLVIRLRTRLPASQEACEKVLASYQRNYRRSSSLKPWVILESSRTAGKDSPAGFLPVCQLSPNGLLTMASI